MHFIGYIQGAAALCVITILMDIAATIMTGMGLCSKDPTRKYALYRFALYVMVGACKCNLIFIKALFKSKNPLYLCLLKHLRVEKTLKVLL